MGGKLDGSEMLGPLLREEVTAGRPWRKSFIVLREN
jgi:hypothetical protein